MFLFFRVLFVLSCCNDDVFSEYFRVSQWPHFHFDILKHRIPPHMSRWTGETLAVPSSEFNSTVSQWLHYHSDILKPPVLPHMKPGDPGDIEVSTFTIAKKYAKATETSSDQVRYQYSSSKT
jgi:hypothetical protein